MNTGVFTKDGVSYYLMTVKEWNQHVATMDKRAARWFDLYDEEVEAHTATREDHENATYEVERLCNQVSKLEAILDEYENYDEDWIN